MHRTHLCSHCLRRRMLLWASAFFVTVGAIGATRATGSGAASRVETAPASVQMAAR